MDLSTFIVAVFCLIDDHVKDLGHLRGRGPTPTPCDSEVITIEVVGEFWQCPASTDCLPLSHSRSSHSSFFVV